MLSRVYGGGAKWESQIRSAKLVANALNKNDMARAMMTAVLMRLPDPGTPVRVADTTGALAKAGYDPDEPRDEQGRWTNGEDDGNVAPSTAHRDPRIQLADVGRSDAPNDPVAEAVPRAAAAARRNLRADTSQAKPVDNERENFWQALGSRLSHEAKSALSQIGRAEVAEGSANLAGTKAVAHALMTYADYHEQTWVGPDGRPIEVPVINTGDPVSDQAALMGHDLFEPNAPLTRPGKNGDWLDPLFNLATLFSMAAGQALRLIGPGAKLAGLAAEALDAATVPAAESNILIGNSGFRNIGKFTDAVSAKYQELYDQHYTGTMQLVSQDLIPNSPLVIGRRTDALARVDLRDWLTNVEGIDEGPGQIIQVNRRLYDPLGSGNYRVPDVYIPGSQTILDGSLQFKTSSMSQIDYQAFSQGAKVILIRPATAPSDLVAGSYGIVY